MLFLFLLVCGIGTVNSLLAAVYVSATRRGRPTLNRLLALLILSFSLRVAKAVCVFFVARIHPVFELAWMVLFAGGGVVFAVYAVRLAGNQSLRRLAAVPVVTAIAVGATFAFDLRAVGWQLFVAALAVNGTAIACTLPVVTGWWLRSVASFMSAVWLLYAALLVAAAVPVRGIPEDLFFNVEAVAFSLAVYALVYLELRIGLLAKVHSRRPDTAAADEALMQRLQQLMERERPYLDASLSLQSLAHTLRVSPQQLSRVVNTQAGTKFTDYVNRFRVEEAVRILATPQGRNRKIGSLAFDCGFNSSSVFYAAFKKVTGRTPSEHVRDTAAT